MGKLYPRKGRIAEGCDADIVVWDGDATRTVSKDTHFHAVDFNVFEGMTFYGVVQQTISGGRVVFEGNEAGYGTLTGDNGWGEIVERKPFGFAYRDTEANDQQNDPVRRKVEREPYTGDVIQV